MIEQKEATSEKAVLIGVITQKQDEAKSTEYLDELEFLTATAGGVVVERFVQKLSINASDYIDALKHARFNTHAENKQPKRMVYVP